MCQAVLELGWGPSAHLTLQVATRGGERPRQAVVRASFPVAEVQSHTDGERQGAGKEEASEELEAGVYTE